MAQIETIIEGLKQLQESWVTSVTRAKEAQNTGEYNTGDQNTGDQNTGERNTGNRNTGDWNTGDRNTGDWNTGERNTGDRNTGDRNTGDQNTGEYNTGDWNTGNRNTGERNTGEYNTGNRNTGDRNTWYFNTTTPTQWLLFNKLATLWDSNWNLIVSFPEYFSFSVDTTERIERNDMTSSEKKYNTDAESMWGYLKKYDTDKTLHTYRKRSFEKAKKKDVAKTLGLPNFDYDIFAEISGITKKDFANKLWKD